MAASPGTLRHIFDAERVWLNRLSERAFPPLTEVGNHGLIQDPSPEPGLNALIRQWPAVWNGWREWLENLSEPELDEKVWIYRAFYPIELRCSTPNEDKFRVPRWKMVLHAINHSTLHRGQVMGMLRTLGKQPPGTDLFNYYLAMAG